MAENKVISAEGFPAIRDEIKKKNKKIVMCHGVFDLLHYGHIEHLREAKSFGDVLVVSVTSEPYVNKGPDRPYYNDAQRTSFLASIEFVDYVMLSNEQTALANINAVQPDIFVKGQEFKSGTDGVTGQISAEIELVEKLGGTIRYTQGIVYSSSKLLNNYFSALPDGVLEYSQKLLDKYGKNVFDRITDYVDKFEDLKILVIGDIIIDEYIFCKPQGLTRKDSTLSTRFQSVEQYPGGSLALTRHMAELCPNVELLSMMGSEDDLYDLIESKMPNSVNLHMLRDNGFVTPVKRRYLKKHPQRNEYDKLFSVNYLNDKDAIKRIRYEEFHKSLHELVPQFDLVAVCDYGHGLIDNESIEIIQNNSRFLSLNCQTNSSNYGTNLITKYTKADSFALDEVEMQLAFPHHGDNREDLLTFLREQLGASTGYLTIGAAGAISEDKEGNKVSVPALTLNVTDTIGAGDAFFSISSLCASTKVPIDISTLLANASASIKACNIGNKNSVKKKDLLKSIKTILNV